MKHRLKEHLTFANIVSSVALFAVLAGGTAVATGTLKIKSRDIVDGQVRSVDLADDDVRGRDVKESTLDRVPDAARLGGVPADQFQSALNGQSCPTGEFVTGVGGDGDLLCGAVDADSDGFSPPDDCDDLNPDVHPGAVENPGNGIDDDCDGTIDEGGPADLDGDGFSPPDDCDDSNPDAYPGAVEIPGNGIDDDCDSVVDESG